MNRGALTILMVGRRKDLFLTVLRIYLNKGGNDKGDEAATNDPPEEIEVTEMVCHPTCQHTWNHHTQSLEGCTNAEHGGGALTLREIDEVEHISREAKAIAELLNQHADVDGKERGCS